MRGVLRLLLVWLCGASLRVTMLAIAPILPLLVSDFDMSAGQVGLLSVLPLAMFSLMALPGSALIGRFGPGRAIGFGLSLVLAGTVWRGLAGGVLTLYGSAALMGVGIAVMQPAMPVAVGAWMPGREAFGTALYANGLIVWELLAVGLTSTWVLPLVGGSWRIASSAWACPVAMALILLMSVKRSPVGVIAMAPKRTAVDWSDPALWTLGVLMAGVSSAYFLSNAFMPLYLTEVGSPTLVTPTLIAFNAAQLLASLLLLGTVGRLAGRALPMVLCAGFALLSAVAFGWLPVYTAVPSAFVAGFVCGGGMVLVLALPPLVVSAGKVRQFAAGMFAVGYGVSFLVGSFGGRLHDWWPVPELLMGTVATMALVQLLAVGWLWRWRRLQL